MTNDLQVGPEKNRIGEWFKRHPAVGLIIFLLFGIIVTVYGLFVWVGIIEPARYIIWSYLAFPGGILIIVMIGHRLYILITDRERFTKENICDRDSFLSILYSILFWWDYIADHWIDSIDNCSVYKVR